MSKIDIRRAIKERKLTIVQVAQNMGIPSQNLQQFMNGNPTVEKLYLIADAIGCDVTDLFYPTEEELAAKTLEAVAMPTTDEPQPSSAPESAKPSPTNNSTQVHFCPHCGTKFQILT